MAKTILLAALAVLLCLPFSAWSGESIGPAPNISVTPTSLPAGASNTWRYSEGQQTAKTIEGLEARIPAARDSGADVTAAQETLIVAKQYQWQGKYAEAALAAEKSRLQLEAASKSQSTVFWLDAQKGLYVPCPPAPLLVGLVLLSFAMPSSGKRRKQGYKAF